ncbi:MAG: ribosome recycling factor [Candidatus Zixiibacteriota bacterium]|nr:MAG: ribosome recycling factor [candidate division Zixibacteria bacterium]
MLDKLYKETRERMKKTLESVTREFGTVRTGKATPQLLDKVVVQAYGTQMPLNQVGTISTPEPRLIVVQVFDKSTVGEVVKSIQAADLGLNPQPDGQIIRIPIPALNEERRLSLVKQCKNIAEDSRVALRNIRRDANDEAKKLEKDKNISEDQQHDALDEIQKFTDEHIKEIDELLAQKEKEIMEI